MVNRILGIKHSDDDLASVKIYAVRYLLSGDWKIMFNIEEAYKIAEIITGWVKRVFNPNVIVVWKGYIIVVYGLSS